MSRQNDNKYSSIAQAIKKGSGTVHIHGWVHRERGSNKIKFVVLRDSSGQMQCVIEKSVVGEDKFAEADKIRIYFGNKKYQKYK